MSADLSADYEQAHANSSELVTATDECADPAVSRVGSVSSSQSSTGWSDHAEASDCRAAYTDALDQLSAAIRSTRNDLATLKESYDAVVKAFQEQDDKAAQEAISVLSHWQANRPPIEGQSDQEGGQSGQGGQDSQDASGADPSFDPRYQCRPGDEEFPSSPSQSSSGSSGSSGSDFPSVTPQAL